MPDMKLTKKKVDLLANGTREERMYATSRSFFLFAAYYFTKFFQFRPAAFHKLFYEDFENLVAGALKEAAWIAYRESAKTSIAKIGLLWIIARKQVIDALRHNGEDVSHWGERLYVNVDSYAKANAQSILFDVVSELQANDLLIQDFGHLYNQPRTKDQAQLELRYHQRHPGRRPHRTHADACLRIPTAQTRFRSTGRLRKHDRRASPATTEKIIRLSRRSEGRPRCPWREPHPR
jgi:hypothetical protein